MNTHPLVDVVREVLDDFHGDHNWAHWAQARLDLALHQHDGCKVFRSDCPLCVAKTEGSP